MKRKLLYVFGVLILATFYVAFTSNSFPQNYVAICNDLATEHKAEVTNKRYFIIIDYTKNVFSKRLWIWDRETKRVVLNCRVSHALKSGLLNASKFSNEISSELSCTGAFVTLGSYKSSFGEGIYQIGMRIKGLEKGKNDNVLRRNIVFHSGNGLHSEGCFMTSAKNNKKIIDLTQNGCFLYVHK